VRIHEEDRAPRHSGIVSWERALLAGTAVSAGLAIVAVSCAGILARIMGVSRTFVPPIVALCAVVATLALLPFGRHGRGPIAVVARLLPPRLDGGFRRRPVVAGLVALLMVLGVAQVGRLSCFMADPALRWGSGYPPVEFGVRHMCMSAYIRAAELARDGVPNVYAEEHYPVYRSDLPGQTRPVQSSVANLAPFVRDAFEYPPPFLLLPWGALFLTNDFLVMRTGWFMLQTLAFCVIALALSRQLGPRRGIPAGLLLPGLLSSFPFLFNFQFGQFHLAAIMLAMGGMLAFSRARYRLGGALLGGAVVTKIFPGLLLIYLAIRRRGRPILWTVIFVAIYVLVGLLVFGPEPYRAFLGYQVPRVASGRAFSFFVRNDLTLAANSSVYAIPFKLQRLGVPGMSAPLANGLVWIYTAMLLGATIVAAYRKRESTLEPAVWLGLLTLCSLRSPEAPNVYVGTSALWLLTLVAVETRGRAAANLLFVVFWIAITVQPPLPDPRATIVLWSSGQAAMLALGFWVLLRRRATDDVPIGMARVPLASQRSPR
jgi:hypothetical protein